MPQYFVKSPRDLAFRSARSLQKARIQPPLYGLLEAYKRYHLVRPSSGNTLPILAEV